MLPSHTRSHREYVDFVSSQKCPLPARHLWVRQALFLCDLTIVRFMMFFTYSMFGRPAWAPEDIFRSMLAMVLCGITSFEIWVDKMREQTFYAVISGFHPDKVPGVGTFYDFTDRILGITNVSKRRLRVLWRTARDKQKSTSDKNADTKKHSDIARRLVERISRVTRKVSTQWEFDENKYARYEVVLKAIFYVCFARCYRETKPSALKSVLLTQHMMVKVGTFDAAHDAFAFYELGYERYSIAQVIPINEKNTGNFTNPQPKDYKEDGTPICQNDMEMYYWGYCAEGLECMSPRTHRQSNQCQ